MCNAEGSALKFQKLVGHTVADSENAGDAVADKDADLGILVCGTGIGMSIAANKVKGAYAACVHDVYQAQRAELSNHANIITLGSQVIGNELAKCIVKEYLSVTYDENSRSAPKLARIYEYEGK